MQIVELWAEIPQKGAPTEDGDLKVSIHGLSCALCLPREERVETGIYEAVGRDSGGNFFDGVE